MLRKMKDKMGSAGIVVILLAPLLTCTAAALVMPRLTKISAQAQAVIQLYPVIGTHAAYEASSYVADFGAAFASPGAAEKAAEAAKTSPAEAAGFLTASRLGDSSGATVSFTADTPQAAEAGLRAAAKEALRQVADNDRRRARIRLDAAKVSLAQAYTQLDGQSAQNLPAKELSAAKDNLLRAATSRLESAVAEVATTTATVESVGQVIRDSPVTTQTLTNSSQQYRVIAVAGVASAVFATLLVLFLRRGTGGRTRRDREAVDPGTPAERPAKQ